MSDDRVIEEIVQEPQDKWVFVTTSGKRIPEKPMSPYLFEKIRNSIEFPAIPTYEISTITGDVEIHEHNEGTLESDEDRKMWEEYQEKLNEANGEVARKMLDLVMLKGLSVQLPEDDSWIEEQEFFDIDVPRDNKLKLKLHYIQTEVIESPADLQRLMQEYMEKIGVRREVVEDVEKSFPDSVPEEESRGTDESAQGEDEGRGRNGDGREYHIVRDRMEL